MRPALSMKPTGWFQVLWSAELGVGEVRPMHYFGRDLIAYRGASGRVVVLGAYCEHLGAHLGYGGTVHEDNIVCPFHAWEWDSAGRNVCIPYQDRPNRARRIRPWPVVERNQSIYLWHDVDEEAPPFEPPDIFTEAFPDDCSTEDRYYVAYPEGCLHREQLQLHPQYVLENAVDFAHFKYVHRAARVPMLARQEAAEHHFYSEFEMTFGATKEVTVMTPGGAVDGGVKSVLAGVGLTYAMFWGPDNMRTVVAVTPVDDSTSDIRSTVWLDRPAGERAEHIPESLNRRMNLANNQFLADLRIWQHQRYTEPPGLATSEASGFRTLRNWCKRWYPEGAAGSGDDLQWAGADADPDRPGQGASPAGGT
jgi:phenylpropionate dioxygenase-like ring-hydroxylating dioxygenase large terminal subunit